MTIVKCEFCPNDIAYSSRNYKKYNLNEHIILCKNCIDNNVSYRKEYCKNNLCLTEKDLSDIKYLFNPCSKKKLYFEKYINYFLMNKYTSNDKIKLNIIEKKNKKLSSKNKKNKIIEERKKKLINLLYNNKIDFKEKGVCYTYIYYGTPSIEYVLEELLEENNIKNNRRIEIIKLFQQNNIKFNEQMISYKQYINGNIMDKNEIIKKAEIEDYLIQNTKYLEYLKYLKYEDAINRAIDEFINNEKLNNKTNNKTNNKINNKINKQIIVDFN